MKVEIWSDVVCPWCYVGKRRFEHALERFEHRDQVEVIYKAFELDPSAEPVCALDEATRLSAKYRVPREDALAMMDRVTQAAAAEGLALDFSISKHGNTLDAHRLIRCALEDYSVAMQHQMNERLLSAYFTEGESIGDLDTLVRLAGSVGMDVTAVRDVLDSDTYLDEVRADEEEAAQLGATGVPFFVFDRHMAVAGAQSPDVALEAMQRAWHAEPHEPA